MDKSKNKVVKTSVIGNTILFFAKLFIGFISNSIAIISDALNSMTDIINSIILMVSVNVGEKSPDKQHPFGHHRSEPIGGLIVAILTIVLGFEVIRVAVTRLLTKSVPLFSKPILYILLGTIAIKTLLYLYTLSSEKKNKSTALFALLVDHRNDIVISIGAIIGFVGSFFNYPFLDSLVGILIGLWIIRSGVFIGIKNIKYLIGEAPKPELLKKISKITLRINAVNSIQKLKAHYVGVLLQVELDIRVNRNISIFRAHTIETKVKKAIEKLDEVDRAFVHVDPIIKSRPH